MRYFDLHCDTAQDIYRNKSDFTDVKQNVNRSAMNCFEKYTQCFAVFSNDTEGHRVNGIDYYKKVVDYLREKVKDEKVIPVMTTEGGHIIEGDIANLDILNAYGVRIFGFAWNGENALAAGELFDPSRPLSPKGKEALKRLDELGIYSDISHLSQGGVKDIMNFGKLPFIATHSNCRSVWNHPRNQTDDQLKELYRRGGLSGLCLYDEIISEKPSVADLMRHLDKMLELGGENCVAIGSDWDGADYPDGIKDISGIEKVYEEIKRCFSPEIAEKAMYKNACRFFGMEE